MERIVQYLDELEDLVCAMLTMKERIRRVLQILFVLITSLLLQALGILLAFSQPPLALAAVSLLIVGMMYKSVTSPISRELVLS